MGTIRRGDQTTTDEWLAQRPKGFGTPPKKPRPGDIVLYRSSMIANTGVVEGLEVPALITAVYGDVGHGCDMTVFRANGLAPLPVKRIPYNEDLGKRHHGAWRFREE